MLDDSKDLTFVKHKGVHSNFISGIAVTNKRSRVQGAGWQPRGGGRSLVAQGTRVIAGSTQPRRC